MEEINTPKLKAIYKDGDMFCLLVGVKSIGESVTGVYRRLTEKQLVEGAETLLKNKAPDEFPNVRAHIKWFREKELKLQAGTT